MNKILLIFVLNISCSQLIIGQISFQGKVFDSEKRPIEYANVFIEGTIHGESTDSAGYFNFKVPIKDTLKLVAKLIGYKDFEKTFTNLKSNTTIELNIVLEDLTYQLEQLTVSSFTNIVSDKGKSTTIKSRDIKRIPGSNDDITLGLRTLPGVQQIGEKGGLFIRGGDNTETKIFIDDLMVPEYYRNGAENMAQRSWFPSNLFGGTFFSSGGYSALYGDGLSGILSLESKKFPLESSYETTLSTIGSSCDLSLVSENNKFLFNPSFTYTNLEPYYKLVKQRKEFIDAPEYKNTYLNSRLKLSDKEIVKFFFAGEKSDLAFTDYYIDNNNYNIFYSTNNSSLFTFLIYEKWFNEKTKLYIGTSYSFNKVNEKNEIVGKSNIEDKLFQSKAIITKKFNEEKIVLTRFLTGQIKLKIGADLQYNDYNHKLNETEYNIYYNHVSVFSDIDWKISSSFLSNVGLRWERDEVSNASFILPRASLGWLISDKSQLLFSYGKYNQIPEWNYIRNDLNTLPKSTHYILTYLKKIGSKTIRVEWYNKNYDSLITLHSSKVGNSGYGYARGIDLFYKEDYSKLGFEYWLSYSYLDTKRKQYDYPIKTRPNFASKHIFTVVTKKFIPSISCYCAVTYNFASGRPYFNPNISDEHYLSERTLDYHNFNLLVANITTIKKKYILTTAISVTNLFNWKQVFSYEYSSDFNSRKAIEPIASRFYYIGLYLNWGKDNSKQVINDLLN